MKLKIIKSLLIPTLGITLSTTTISSLTSCTNNNEIKNYYLTGGSTSLKGIEGKGGLDNNQWKLYLDEKEVTNNITWKLQSVNGKQWSNSLTINNGFVHWSKDITKGEYFFYVIAKCGNNDTAFSEQIKLSVDSYGLSGGSTELKGIYQKDLQDDNQWKLSIGGADITSNINWGVSNLSDDNLTNNIFVNDGVVSWSGNIHAGQYNFCITATYNEVVVKSPIIRLIINEYVLNGGSTELKSMFGEDDHDTKSWQLSLDGNVITENIVWGLEDTFENPIAGISINNGTVSWSDNIAVGEYYFYVTATYDGLKVKSPQIKLTISQYILDGGSTQLSGIQNKVGNDNKSWQLSLDGKIITDNIDWAIEDFFDEVPIVGISINEGVVSWSDNIAAGQYYFCVVATCNGLTTKSSLITLTISQYILSGGSTELRGIQGKAESDTKSWQLSIGEQQITNNINWAIEDSVSGKPINGMFVDNGVVSWGNIATFEYDFYVTATYDGLKIKSQLIKLTISQYILNGGSTELSSIVLN